MIRYCVSCGKRYDSKVMCPACRRARNSTVRECAQIVRHADVLHLRDAREAVVELILELIREPE